MRSWCRLVWLSAFALLVVWPATSAFAVSVSGRSSTEIEWFDSADEKTVLPFYQYLRLNVRDIDDNGLDFRGYGRLADDLANEEDVDSQLYYAYLEKNNLFKDVGLKLGRQFITTTAGASMMDGLQVKYDGLKNFGVKLFAGGDVSYYSGYEGGDIIGGLAFTAEFFDDLNLELSYLQKWDDGDLSHELFGFAADYTYRELINLFADVQYDYLSDSISYFSSGFNYYRSDFWKLRCEYLYSLPVFSSTSIYSVFAVSEYEELSAQLDFNHGDGIRSFVRTTLEMYEEVDNALVYELGVEKIRTDRFSGYLTLVLRDDEEGQEDKGIKARAAYRFNSTIQAGVGAHYNSFERRIEADSDTTTSSRFWVDCVGTITDTINVEAKLERADSDLWDEYNRGRIRLNVLF